MIFAVLGFGIGQLVAAGACACVAGAIFLPACVIKAIIGGKH